MDTLETAPPTDESDKPRYRLSQFEGPLDLLLFLIRKNEINITNIPIAEITEQYLTILEYSTGVNLEDASEFFLMAATLLYIKSRMLLPVDVDLEDELDDPRSELVLSLIEYEKYRKLTDLMARLEEENEWVIERKRTQRTLPFPDEKDLWERADAWDLLKSFSKVMRHLGTEEVINLWEEVTINEKITLIHEYLEDRGEFSFDDILVNPGSVVEVISGFLAVLEMVKAGEIDVFQNTLFGDIRIRARVGRDGDGVE